MLLIAFHYPPCAVSSGVQRTLSFSMHLRDHGWRVTVLTAGSGAHERVNPQQLSDIPQDITVVRTPCLDAARHLAIHGRYWSRLALPDRWMSWKFTAVPRGLQVIRSRRIDVIWSTYPIATAHLVGARLAALSGVPWIADFRDPMVERVAATGELFPQDPALRAARLRVEARAARGASRLIFCTDAARCIAVERYPGLDPRRLQVIPNGYEEHAFRDAERLASHAPSRRHVLLHSGTVYPGADRDPRALLHAIRSLADRQLLTQGNFELRLRDPGNEDYFLRLIAEQQLSGLVTVAPPLPYREALAEMLRADGLLLLQGHTSNPAVPAKLYEYLRAARPIIALVHPDGETAATLRSLGIGTMASLTDAEAIARLLSRWIADPTGLGDAHAPREAVEEFSRARLTARLARSLDQVLAEQRRLTSG